MANLDLLQIGSGKDEVGGSLGERWIDRDGGLGSGSMSPSWLAVFVEVPSGMRRIGLLQLRPAPATVAWLRVSAQAVRRKR